MGTYSHNVGCQTQARFAILNCQHGDGNQNAQKRLRSRPRFGDKLVAVIALGSIKKLHLDPTKPPVLDGISLRIAQGETCGLCGPGASGKSLLLKIICGLVRPESGSVEVAGVNLNAASPDILRKIQ